MQLKVGGGVVAMLLALACSDPSSKPSAPRLGESGGAGESTESDSNNSMGGAVGEPPAAAPASFGFDSFSPQGLVPGDGEGGEGSLPLGPPYGVSTGPGDAIVGDSEECDDGPGDDVDACTAAGQTRDQPVVAAPANVAGERYLGAGRHPIAGLEDGFITTFVETGDDAPAIGATLFNIWGRRARTVTVSEGASPIYEANPVAAALPNGAFAVAWSDFDGDGSDIGIALRRVDGDGSLGELRAANAGREFSQLNADMLWTGSQLVVAWEDYSDPSSGPDLRYRLFDADLNPASDDVALATSALPEAAVALAPFNDGWAAAYREGAADGKENVVVMVGDETFRVGPVMGGPLDDRPALVELDSTHLLLAFSAGTDPGMTGTYNVPRIRYATIDTAGSTTPAFQSLQPLDDIYTLDTQVSHLSPAAAAGPDGVYVSWRSEARPGDAAGDQLWLKYLRWRPTEVPQLKAREQEMLLPRTCDENVGDQRTPALATVPLPPYGALAMAWDQYTTVAGTTGRPDVTVGYAPTHERTPDKAAIFKETWTMADGALPSYWSTEVTGAATPISVVGKQARVGPAAGNSSGLLQVNDINALNVDMTVKMQWNINGARSTLFARRSDAEPNVYIFAYFGTQVNDTWHIYWVNAASQLISLASAPQPPIFTNYGQQVDYRARFRAVTNPDATVFLGAKLWAADAAEPSAWLMSTTLAASSTAAQTFANRSGRFGLVGAESQAGRQTTFDDFVVHYYPDSYLGNFSSDIEPAAPLRRSPATYGACRPDQTCSAFTGCCTTNADCGTGLSCVAIQGHLAGLGSSANTCVPSHCFNRVVDIAAGETRADCGGPCPPCLGSSSALPGAATYCSATTPCGIGEGDCDSGAECLPGLLCTNDNGYKYGWGQIDDACAPSHCINRIQEAALGETGIDCGGECGSCACDSANGAYWHCRPWCPCAHGHGTCRYYDECQPGTVCGSTSSGARFGFAAGTKACVVPHCNNGSQDVAFGETSVDCGGGCGCGGCPEGCVN
jgi:hypothetical protein